MKLKILDQDYLEKLQRLPENQRSGWYSRSNGWLDVFFENKKWYLQTKIELEGTIDLVMDGDPPSTDLENSIRVYNILGRKISPVQASDSRLWTCLCHDMFWDYMIWRWPPIKDGTISDRYLASGNSSRSLSRNGIARLWWFAHLTYDSARSDPYELTRIFLRHQDIPHNMLERNLGRNKIVLHAALDFLKRRTDVSGKDDYVKLAKILNKLGGVRLLDCLSTQEITSYLEKRFPPQ